MILKKPYAFLIKYFKVIHALLAVLYVYLAFKVSSILNFYNGFINGTIGKINAINYISNLPYLAIILSIIICIILFILMNYKKKPKLLYALLIILYIIVFALIFITSNGLTIIYNSVLETKTTLLYRDFLRIIILFQYASIVLTVIRAIGFDIKKFNFSEDINELNIDVTDDEEVELVMGVNSHKLTQKWNRKLRELKYYYAENKIFATVMFGIIILLVLSTITIDTTFIHKVYKQNETFESDNFKMQITNSYITNETYTGNTISNNSTFLIIKLYIQPLKTQMSLNTSNVILRIGSNNYTITKKYYTYFKDIGTGYKSQTIKSANNYILVYEIPNNEENESMTLSYTGSAKEIKVKLSPIKLDDDDKSKISEYNLNEEVDFTNSFYEGSKFLISSIDINNKFAYNYTYTINDKEYTGKKYITSASNTILYLDITSNYNTSTTDYEFITTYSTIKYMINNEEYTSSIVGDKTPGNNSKGIYIEVDKQIENADKIWLEVNIRNVKYKYYLK